MFEIFKKRSNKETKEGEGDDYNPDNVSVYYEGTLVSPEYAAETLVYPNNGTKIRDNFNTQGYSFHNLFPHGKGKIVYKDGDTVLEEYEGEFEYGQYHGKGRLVDLNGQILEGTFKENKFKE